MIMNKGESIISHQDQGTKSKKPFYFYAMVNGLVMTIEPFPFSIFRKLLHYLVRTHWEGPDQNVVVGASRRLNIRYVSCYIMFQYIIKHMFRKQHKLKSFDCFETSILSRHDECIAFGTRGVQKID